MSTVAERHADVPPWRVAGGCSVWDRDARRTADDRGTLSMTSVFLSFAEEDSTVAARLMDWLRGRGVDCYSWQDPQRRGGGVIEGNQGRIPRAPHVPGALFP